MNREIRQLVILSVLNAEKGRPVPAQTLRWFLGEAYAADPDSGQARFRDDMRGLREAGLVAFASLRPDQQVRLVKYAAKDPVLHLTVAEHDALQEARRLTGKTAVGVGPVRPQPAVEKLAVITALIRNLEEAPASVATVSELSRATGLRPGRVRTLLQRLEQIRIAYRGQHSVPLAGLEVERDAASPFGRLLETEAGLRTGPDPEYPLRRIGLDEFGLFAYSSSEIDDRLEVIDAALTSTGHTDKESLRSAQAKLVSWQAELRKLDAREREGPTSR